MTETKQKIFSRGLIGITSFTDEDILRGAFKALVPGAEDSRTRVTVHGTFPQGGSNEFPQGVRSMMEAEKSSNAENASFAKHVLSQMGAHYKYLATEQCIVMASQDMLILTWLDALLAEKHGVLVYRTEGFSERKRFEPEFYVFSTVENGRLIERAKYSVIKDNWINKPNSIATWALLPHIGMAA